MLIQIPAQYIYDISNLAQNFSNLFYFIHFLEMTKIYLRSDYMIIISNTSAHQIKIFLIKIHNMNFEISVNA